MLVTLCEHREPSFRAAGSRHSAESVLRAVVGAAAGALTDGAECRDRGRGWNQIAFARSALTGGAGNSARVLEALSLRRMRLMFETLPVPHDGGGVIHTARAAGTADGPGVGGSGAPGRGGWSGGDTASHSAGSIAARGGVSLWRRGCCILPALCDARAGVSLRGGGLLARGFRWERSGRDGLAAGRMSGAELAGGFAAVADSQVRVFEHRDTMLAGWGASGRGLAHGTRDGRRAAAWRRPCVARATGRDASRRRDGFTRASYGMARASEGRTRFQTVRASRLTLGE